jgi:hypothetical protein
MNTTHLKIIMIKYITNLFVCLSIFLGVISCKSDNKISLVEISESVATERKSSLSNKEIKQLDSVNIYYQIRGHCYAYSSKKNAEPSNGEAHSSNLPMKNNNSFPNHGVYLLINETEYTPIDSVYLGCKLYLINTSDELVTFKASDSRLYIVAEALNDKNEWMPISYLPSSYCGNSYHTVKLDENEYWGFDIPVFKGSFKTKLRYTLTIDKENKISSNEVIAFINRSQLDKKNKQGHTPNNIMDPYDD